jgi:hypothetical protein
MLASAAPVTRCFGRSTNRPVIPGGVAWAAAKPGARPPDRDSSPGSRGPIPGNWVPIEGAQATLTCHRPSTGGAYPVCTGPNLQNEKTKTEKNASDDRPKLFTNCKFCMNTAALILLANFYAIVACESPKRDSISGLHHGTPLPHTSTRWE